MQVTSDGNWFSVDTPSAPAAAVGAAMLAARMDRVMATLPDAAEHADQNVEHVHQLRVACRRAAAALHAFETLAPRRARKLDKWLKRIRRAAGPARDADVLTERFRREHGETAHADEVLQRLAAARTKAQEKLAAVHEQAGKGKLARVATQCQAAFERKAAEDDAVSFEKFGRQALECALGPVAKFDAGQATAAELHGLRIAAKRLRYSLELFHGVLPDELAREAYGDIEEIQERLGKLNDRHSAQVRWQEWLAEAPADGFAALLAELVAEEWRIGEEIRRDFLGWWSERRQAAHVEKLRSSLGMDL